MYTRTSIIRAPEKGIYRFFLIWDAHKAMQRTVTAIAFFVHTCNMHDIGGEASFIPYLRKNMEGGTCLILVFRSDFTIFAYLNACVIKWLGNGTQSKCKIQFLLRINGWLWFYVYRHVGPKALIASSRPRFSLLREHITVSKQWN